MDGLYNKDLFSLRSLMPLQDLRSASYQGYPMFLLWEFLFLSTCCIQIIGGDPLHP